MKVISQYAVSLLNAGPKAKVDIEKILKDEFNSKIYTLKLTGKEGNGNYINSFIYKVKKALFSLRFLRGDDLTIIQFPFNNDTRFTKNLKHKLALIHDIEGIRKQDEKIESREINFLSTCEYIVAHNSKMKEYLITKGINEKKIYSLELFDYLCNVTKKDNFNFDASNLKVVYTGNLDKAPFIKQLESEKMRFSMNVYGVSTEKIENHKIVYKGKFPPDELPNHIEGGLGLVWDGNFDESDQNKGFKNYTKYNNPHKLSCYLAAGIPVIVWNKSAIADLIDKYNIGYKVNNLYEINNIDFSDYEDKLSNVKELSTKVRSGYFTKKIIREVLADFYECKEQ